ncbi:uncharacterized protein LOC103572493 [Microplitis demolitor]|uniref:uncharacterized protein LOC103572493 n=1 Tax=Microplitis demolitor TaxID=69319 RepID=UPI0004CDD4EE|nr:uncharacterized protein LOC103572493 [Microplitis demolitor]
MGAYKHEGPDWIRLDDPFFLTVQWEFASTIDWLITVLPVREPKESAGKRLSILEYFLSMDEEKFRVLLEHCPPWTKQHLMKARSRRLQRRYSRIVILVVQESDLELE